MNYKLLFIAIFVLFAAGAPEINCISKSEGKSKEQALIDAAYRNDLDSVKELLLETKISVNIYNGYGIRPIHLAAANKNCDMIALLVAKGADVNVIDNDNKTPLHYVFKPHNILRLKTCSLKAVEVVEKLFKAGANPNAQENGYHFTPFYTALQTQTPDLLEILYLFVKAGFDPNIVDKWGNTSLHHCMRMKNIINSDKSLDWIKLLLDAGAKLDVKNRDGKIPRDMINRRLYPKIYELLTPEARLKSRDGVLRLLSGLFYK